MNETKRLALIQLCGTHEFSEEKLEKARSTNFVTCEKCPLEWGEKEELSKRFPIHFKNVK